MWHHQLMTSSINSGQRKFLQKCITQYNIKQTAKLYFFAFRSVEIFTFKSHLYRQGVSHTRCLSYDIGPNRQSLKMPELHCVGLKVRKWERWHLSGKCINNWLHLPLNNCLNCEPRWITGLIAIDEIQNLTLFAQYTVLFRADQVSFGLFMY